MPHDKRWAIVRGLALSVLSRTEAAARLDARVYAIERRLLPLRSVLAQAAATDDDPEAVLQTLTTSTALANNPSRLPREAAPDSAAAPPGGPLPTEDAIAAALRSSKFLRCKVCGDLLCR